MGRRSRGRRRRRRRRNWQGSSCSVRPVKNCLSPSVGKRK